MCFCANFYSIFVVSVHGFIIGFPSDSTFCQFVQQIEDFSKLTTQENNLVFVLYI